MKDLGIFELENELSIELPTRNLMRRHRHRHHGGTSASAKNGSGANAASQSTTVSPVQTSVSTGGDARNKISGGITTSQTSTQSNTPINLALG